MAKLVLNIKMRRRLLVVQLAYTLIPVALPTLPYPHGTRTHPSLTPRYPNSPSPYPTVPEPTLPYPTVPEPSLLCL